MNHYCHFHPTSPAKWRCNKCNRFYDNACLPKANEKQQQGQCPFCQSALEYLFTENSPKSEHYVLSQLLKDCFTDTNVYLLCISILIALLASLLTIHTSFKVLLCISGVLLINLHVTRKSTYLRHEFQQTGRRRPSLSKKYQQPTDTIFSPATSAQLTFIAGLLLLFPVYCFYSLNWFIGLALLLFGGGIFPCLVIFSFHTSDNEQNIPLSKLFKELKPYLLKLSLQSISLFWIVLFVSDLSLSLIPFSISLILSAALSTLALFIILNISTRTFMLARHKLGSQQNKTIAPKGPGTIYSHDQISTLDTDIDLALKTGQYGQVVALLEEALKRNGNSNLRRQQLFLILIELKDLEKLSRYAGLFLHWMLERNKIKDASQFLYQLRKNDPAFLLHDISLMNKLAKQFFRTKKHALVLWLAEDARTRHKPSADLAGLYLTASQAMITHFQDLEKGEEYLLFIIKSCGEYPSAQAAKALLIHLQNNHKKQQDLRH